MDKHIRYSVGNAMIHANVCICPRFPFVEPVAHKLKGRCATYATTNRPKHQQEPEKIARNSMPGGAYPYEVFKNFRLLSTPF